MTHTPRTEDIRQIVGDALCPDPDAPVHKHSCPGDERFDAWYERACREATAEALRETAEDASMPGGPRAAVARWLRDRAEQIQTGGEA